MNYFLLAVGLTAGFAVGRLYQWAKDRYPESQEMIRLKISRMRAERAEWEHQEEKARMKTSDLLDKRMANGKRKR